MRVYEDALERCSAYFYGGNDSSKGRLRKDIACGGLCDIGCS
jgi:hypothetical protein